MVLPTTANGADKLGRNNIILFGTDGHRSEYIEAVKADEGDNGVMLTVIGKTLQGLAAQRITLLDNDEYNYGYDHRRIHDFSRRQKITSTVQLGYMSTTTYTASNPALTASSEICT